MSACLVVDFDDRPIGLMSLREAVSQLASTLADGVERLHVVLADETQRFRSQHLDIAAPLIVRQARAHGYLPLSDRDTERVSRRVLFARDRWTCQYCGHRPAPARAFKELTVDHVRPAHLFESRAQATWWENVTTACRPCNERKGGLLPMDSPTGLPRSVPTRPTYVQLVFGGRLNAQQQDYVDTYFSEVGVAAL